jgi:hypothetical protein
MMFCMMLSSSLNSLCRCDIAANLVNDVAMPGSAEVQKQVQRLTQQARIQGPSSKVKGTNGTLQHAGRAESQLMVVAIWLRFAAARLLVWNHNYNVKPREVSASQERLTSAAARIWQTRCDPTPCEATFLHPLQSVQHAEFMSTGSLEKLHPVPVHTPHC